MADDRFAAALAPRIKAILSSADLNSISAKGVRKILISQGVEEGQIKHSKAAIDAITTELFNALRNPSSVPSATASSSTSTHPSHPSNIYHPPTSPQVPLHHSNSASVPASGSGAGLKREREYSPSGYGHTSPNHNKKPKLENFNGHHALNQAQPSQPRPRPQPQPQPPILSDEAYARQLQAQLNNLDSRPSSSRTTTNKPKPKPKAKSKSSATATAAAKKAKNEEKMKMKKERERVKKEMRERGEEVSDDEHSDVEDEKPKRGGGGAFNKLMLLSPSLQALTGQAQLSRPQTVKALWVHIKGNELQDPSDKRFILCDGPMRNIFNTDRLHMMTMNKELGKHLFNPDEIIQ